MRFATVSLAGWIVVLAASARLAGAQPAPTCTHAAFPLDGTPLTVTLCVPPDARSPVAVAESLAHGSATATRTLTIDVVPGAKVTHVVDEVPLDGVGSSKHLHLTIAYHDGSAAIEHALLLPGALVLK